MTLFGHIPHPRPYFLELFWSMRRFIKRCFGLKKKNHAPVFSQPFEDIVARHSWICNILTHWLPPKDLWAGYPACEAGAGDCLAAASMVIGLGASHVTIVETEAPVEGPRQAAVLNALRDLGYPCEADLLTADGNLNNQKCTYERTYMESHQGNSNCALVYSICVGEHVEDLCAFFRKCRTMLRHDGVMMHYIDLGGHGIFEDPMPPLEFHRYSDFTYRAIYPRYNRATRRFVSDYVWAVKAAGFDNIVTIPTRVADPAYINYLKPHLKSRAKAVPSDELSVVEFVLTAKASDN